MGVSVECRAAAIEGCEGVEVLDGVGAEAITQSG